MVAGALKTRTLKPSLEGWKLRWGSVRTTLGSSLETFLRGMETGAVHRNRGPAQTLKPSLEGWKHR